MPLTCTKTKHTTRQAAEDQREDLYKHDKADRTRSRFGKMSVYLCPVCQHYHVGHPEKSYTDKKHGRKRTRGESSGLLNRRGQD